MGIWGYGIIIFFNGGKYYEILLLFSYFCIYMYFGISLLFNSIMDDNKTDNVWIMNMLMDIRGKLNWQIIVIISG